MICASCNSPFDAQAAAISCSTCSMSSGCSKTRCPLCGYEMTLEPGLVGIFRSLGRAFRSFLPQATAKSDATGNCCGTITLAQLKQGESCVIEKYHQVSHVRKFLSLGILPGTYVTVLKHSPVVVLRVGYSEFAFDRPLADTVQVHRLAK